MTTTTTSNRKLPRGKRWTYADYCRIPPDRKRHEIIDGRHYVSPSPSHPHQWVQGQLSGELNNRISRKRLGRVYGAPLDVHLGRGTVVQPDIVVLTDSLGRALTEKKVVGAPDLLVEVLSPSTRTHDRKRKFERYQRGGSRVLARRPGGAPDRAVRAARWQVWPTSVRRGSHPTAHPAAGRVRSRDRLGSECRVNGKPGASLAEHELRHDDQPAFATHRGEELRFDLIAPPLQHHCDAHRSHRRSW
ncbi:MAG: Uma2 family endonuclease [Planctomycetes bacterium]|nr:Uma2 family endonuclease [Planctomycetota bacterium]